jgi:hypothetical protein
MKTRFRPMAAIASFRALELLAGRLKAATSNTKEAARPTRAKLSSCDENH